MRNPLKVTLRDARLGLAKSQRFGFLFFTREGVPSLRRVSQTVSPVPTLPCGTSRNRLLGLWPSNVLRLAGQHVNQVKGFVREHCQTPEPDRG